MLTDSTILLSLFGAGELERIVQDIIFRRVGINGVLMFFLASACLYIQHLKQQLRLSDDRVRTAAERVKFADERRAATEGKFASGQELLDLMKGIGRSIIRIPLLSGDSNCRDILLVEDEKALHFFKEAIEDEILGARVRLANNGAEGLAAVMNNPPSLIITDLVMPVMDGFQFIETLRRRYPQIPILAVSAYVDNETEIVAKIGELPTRFRFLPKPTTLASLLSEVRCLMQSQVQEAPKSAAI